MTSDDWGAAGREPDPERKPTLPADRLATPQPDPPPPQERADPGPVESQAVAPQAAEPEAVTEPEPEPVRAPESMPGLPSGMVGRQIAGYRLEAETGRGGMAVVYRAKDL
ncbi:hypothetical protein ACIBH3_26730, partial [Kitasatospora sp. NPDC050543]